MSYPGGNLLDETFPLDDPEECAAVVRAMAWGILPWPNRNPEFYNAPENRHRTMVMKICQAYAFAKGYKLSIYGQSGEHITWQLRKVKWHINQINNPPFTELATTEYLDTPLQKSLQRLLELTE